VAPLGAGRAAVRAACGGQPAPRKGACWCPCQQARAAERCAHDQWGRDVVRRLQQTTSALLVSEARQPCATAGAPRGPPGLGVPRARLLEDQVRVVLYLFFKAAGRPGRRRGRLGLASRRRRRRLAGRRGVRRLRWRRCRERRLRGAGLGDHARDRGGRLGRQRRGVLGQRGQDGRERAGRQRQRRPRRRRPVRAARRGRQLLVQEGQDGLRAGRCSGVSLQLSPLRCGRYSCVWRK